MIEKNVRWLKHHFPNLDFISSYDPIGKWYIFRNGNPIYVGVIIKRDESDYWDLHTMGSNKIVTLFSDSGEITNVDIRWRILKEWNGNN